MRHPNDFYETNDKITQHLLSRVHVAGIVTDPTVGDGAISLVLACSDPIKRIITNDIDPAFEADYHGDATDPLHPLWSMKNGPDWVVTNPPFTDAPRILPPAYDAARVGVAFLLRLSYLEPCRNRAAWLREHESFLTNIIIFSQPRPSFTGDGRTDNVTTAWMVWRKPQFVQMEYSTKVEFVPHWKVRSSMEGLFK